MVRTEMHRTCQAELVKKVLTRFAAVSVVSVALLAGVTTVGLNGHGPSASAASSKGAKSSKSSKKKAAKVEPVVTTAPERPTKDATERIRQLTTQLGRSIGVKVTAPTCPAGVRTDKPVEYSCVVGFDGTIVSFFVRPDPSGFGEQIRSAYAIIPTVEVNRAAGPGSTCSKSKLIIAIAGTPVICKLGKGREIEIEISLELAKIWTIDSSVSAATTTTSPTTSTTSSRPAAPRTAPTQAG
jgi:hypothetical protein